MKRYPSESTMVHGWFEDTGDVYYEIVQPVPQCEPGCCLTPNWRIMLRDPKTGEIHNGHTSWYRPLTKAAREVIEYTNWACEDGKEIAARETWGKKCKGCAYGRECKHDHFCKIAGRTWLT